MAVQVYTVNGATAASSSSLPDWLTRKREAKGKGKRVAREHVEGTLELIQGFEFPEASNRVKTTRDGHHVIATGTYKPQMRVWDLEQLSLKFERHSDAENVDFVILSDDWTKTIHLQNDRTIELHTQGGFHYRTRIPRFGRSLAYHFPSCDAYLTASGNEVYRLNLEQGRFMNPLQLEDDEGEILGVNVVDINPVHQLLAFGIDGNGSTQFWDPRSRSSLGTLRLPRSRLFPIASQALDQSLSVTAISSRADGLTYAIGTSTGHTLLYDIRARNAFGMKDQGYGLPIKNVTWIEGGSRMASDTLVMSADKKVIKIWDKESPSVNFASITPANDLNHVHHIPSSGLILTSNEGIQMGTYYIPQLGPAPRWASFLENITEEMEDQTTRNVYQDYKFLERSELKSLGLDNLIGTPALKPYMHGYFVSLKLYETARVIANPFAYDEYREKVVKDKLDKMAEGRIRTRKDQTAGVKVNKKLAEKVLRDEEKRKKKLERKQKRKAAADDMDVDGEEGSEEDEEVSGGEPKSISILNDPRFAKVFEDPEFAIDETSREFAMLNPSSIANRGKTAVEEEEDESDKFSSDGLGSDDSASGSEGRGDEDEDSDSSADGELTKYDKRRPRPEKTKRPIQRTAKVDMVPMRTHATGQYRTHDANASFGQRRAPRSASNSRRKQDDEPMEISWVPDAVGGARSDDTSKAGQGAKGKKEGAKRRGVETFGSGLERGPGENEREVAESERHGRTQRRKGVRSGSKSAFRRI